MDKYAVLCLVYTFFVYTYARPEYLSVDGNKEDVILNLWKDANAFRLCLGNNANDLLHHFETLPDDKNSNVDENSQNAESAEVEDNIFVKFAYVDKSEPTDDNSKNFMLDKDENDKSNEDTDESNKSSKLSKGEFDSDSRDSTDERTEYSSSCEDEYYSDSSESTDGSSEYSEWSEDESDSYSNKSIDGSDENSELAENVSGVGSSDSTDGSRAYSELAKSEKY